MHDYDRRPIAAGTTASSGETVDNIHWFYVDHEKIAESALKGHNARLGKIETTKLIRENVVQTTGTTTDGRTFRIETIFFIKNMIIQSDAQIVVEGTVAMGPVPTVLARVEASVVTLLEALTSLGVDRREYFNFGKGWVNIAQDIEAWRRGDPVDTKELRSRLNSMVKYAKDLTDTVRRKSLLDQPLAKLIDEARKALGAAARGVPDIG